MKMRLSSEYNLAGPVLIARSHCHLLPPEDLGQ